MAGSLALELDGFGVAFGAQVVLAEIDLRVPRSSLWNLVGPAGSGKSTLLRTLAGLNDAQPAVRTWGIACVDGAVYSHARRRSSQRGPSSAERRRVTLVLQNARFLTATVRENLASGLPNRASLTRAEQNAYLSDRLEKWGLSDLIRNLDASVLSLSLGLQRRLAVVRADLTNPAAVFVDEPTVGLDDHEASLLIELLRNIAQARAVVLVTHNRQHAQLLGGKTALLAGGRIQEVSDTATFFTAPATAAGDMFLRTGGAAVPSPAARPEDLDESVSRPPPLPAAAENVVRSRYLGPRGFYWLYPGRLGGLPRPGIAADLVDDLAGLRRLGITILVTLEELETVPRRLCASAGIKLHFFPIADMRAPSLRGAWNLCSEIERWMGGGQVVAVHCRAGMGRTGTVLACQLIWDGDSAVDAIDSVRGINSNFVQSDEQVGFLTAFYEWLDKSRRASVDPLNEVARITNGDTNVT